MAGLFRHVDAATKRIFGSRSVKVLSLAIIFVAWTVGPQAATAQNTSGPYYQQPSPTAQPAPAAQPVGSVYGAPAQSTRPVQPTVQPGYGTTGQGQSAYQPGRTMVPAPMAGPVTPVARPAAAPRAVRAPFVLSPSQQAEVDRVLFDWCNRSGQVKRFEAKFARWVFNAAFDRPGQNPPRELGQVWYVAPDKGRIEVAGDRPEKWICDGQSMWEFNFVKKQVVGRRLPANMQGRAISAGPLPFLFNSSVEDLKRRYFIRLLPPPQGVQGQIWLEAYPRYMSDAANFQRAELIINKQQMMLHALQLYENNGKSRTAFQFYDAKINANNWFEGLFSADPFAIKPPTGWQIYVERQNVATGAAPIR